MDKKKCKKVDEKNEYQKIEGKLYNYYRYKNEIGKLKATMENMEKHIKEIGDRIKNAHNYINLDVDIASVCIGKRVQTSSNSTSYFERQLEHEVTKLQREKIDKIKRLYKMDRRIRDMEGLICEMDYYLSPLDLEDKKLIELRYRYKKNFSAMAIEMNMSSSTAHRRKEKIISNLYI